MGMNIGSGGSGDPEEMVDINTTPLIDVMLVLLIMFIITIPIQTHAVKMNMPVGPSAVPPKPPEIVRIDVDFDGTIGWNGTIVCDDYKVYETVAKLGERKEAGCAAHARRKFDELDSPVGTEAIRRFERIYRIERAIANLSSERRLEARKLLSKKRWDALHEWLELERSRVADGSATARALDYSLKRWGALTQFLDDGQLPIDNNWIENQIRPIAIGRNNWLFAGSLRAGQRAAAVMSLIQSAKLNGHDPYAYLKDVLARLPTHKHSQIEELLPHRWQPTQP